MTPTKIAGAFPFKPHILFRLNLIVTILFSFYNTAGAAEIFDTMVTKVIDGDTIISPDAQVKLFGVNTPQRGLRCSREATDRLRQLALAEELRR